MGPFDEKILEHDGLIILFIPGGIEERHRANLCLFFDCCKER